MLNFRIFFFHENRDDLRAYLNRHGVPTAVHYPRVIYMQCAYLDQSLEGSCPSAEKAAKTVLSLPMHPYLSCEHQDYIIGRISEFLGCP